MNDFDYDCYQKKVTARSAKNKVRPKKGCTLPSDYLTEAEKKKLNGEVEIMNPDSLKRPIKYGYFKMLNKEQQEGYLNWLFEVYDATFTDIGKMMEVKGNTLMKYCNSRNLDILRRPENGHVMAKSKVKAWQEFCGMDISETVQVAEETVSEVDVTAIGPVSYESFKTMTREIQEKYLAHLINVFEATFADISRMMGVTPITFRTLKNRANLDIPKPLHYRMPKDKKAAWRKFCGVQETEPAKEEATEPDLDIPAEEPIEFDIQQVYDCEDESPVEDAKKEDSIIDILPEKSPREKTLVNYEYHMEFRNLRRWGELFEVLKSMPLPEDGVVHIEVSSRKPEEKANPIGFASPPKTTEV